MTTGYLQDILEKARILSASANSSDVTDEKMLKMLDSYYQNDLPAELRVLKLKDLYTFNTYPGIDVYPFDFDHWTTVSKPVYCSKREIIIFQDVSSFWNYDSEKQYDEILAAADGTEGPYSGTTSASPMLRSTYNNPIVETKSATTYEQGISNYPPSFSVPNISRVQNILITANTASSAVIVSDDGGGNLIGDCISGTIDYNTGVVSNLVFTEIIPSGTSIYIRYVPVTQGYPYKILYTQSQFTLRPVPDQSYEVEITAYRKPSAALLGITSYTAPNLSGRPENFEWWEILAFGIAKKLYQERLDMDGVQLMQMYMDDAIDKALTRTYAELGEKQAGTIYRNEASEQSVYGRFR